MRLFPKKERGGGGGGGGSFREPLFINKEDSHDERYAIHIVRTFFFFLSVFLLT